MTTLQLCLSGHGDCVLTVRAIYSLGWNCWLSAGPSELERYMISELESDFLYPSRSNLMGPLNSPYMNYS